MPNFGSMFVCVCVCVSACVGECGCVYDWSSHIQFCFLPSLLSLSHFTPVPGRWAIYETRSERIFSSDAKARPPLLPDKWVTVSGDLGPRARGNLSLAYRPSHPPPMPCCRLIGKGKKSTEINFSGCCRT